MDPATWKLSAAMLTAVLGSACDARLDRAGVRAEAIRTEGSTVAGGQDRPEGMKGEVKPRSVHGFVQNIEELTESNRDFRRVLYTASNLQLVLMSVPAGERIGAETHRVDQFFRVESGAGSIVIEGKRTEIGPGSAMLVPAGTKHDVVAGEKAPLKLYTLYAPPNHRDGVVHRTRSDAERDEEKFDGRTTE